MSSTARVAGSTKAVIYCRVSTGKQVSHGHGLDSQEMRGRDYAARNGYQVAAVFLDEGVSGGLQDRPGTKQLLAFLRAAHEPIVVIIDDISRFARNVDAHLHLKASIERLGGRLESPSHRFGDEPEDRFAELVLASAAELARNQNSRQVRNRMRDRLLAGAWIFQAPRGYLFGRHPQHGKLLLRDEPFASVIKEALEGFACGRFESQPDVQRFLETTGVFSTAPQGRVHLQQVGKLLRCQLYTGHYEFPEWNVGWMKGLHEPLISLATFNRNQERLGERAKAPFRRDLRLDFPLRGFVLCDCCGSPLTAASSRGRNGMHPYYRCYHRACSVYGKGIKARQMEAEFERLLGRARPSPQVITATKRAVELIWKQKVAQVGDRRKQRLAEIRRIDAKVVDLIDAAVSTTSRDMRQHYEDQVARLSKTKSALQEAIALDTGRDTTIGTAVGTALDFMANPQQLWMGGAYDDKRLVLKLTFSHRLRYSRTSGFGTADFSLPFKLLQSKSVADFGMVDHRLESWNQLLEVLQDWTVILKSHQFGSVVEDALPEGRDTPAHRHRSCCITQHDRVPLSKPEHA